MSRLVNISSDADQPVLIDAARVALLETDAGRNILNIRYTSGDKANVLASQCDIDIDRIAQKLSLSDRSMVALGKRHYAAAQAVNFLATAQPAQDGSVAILAGVQGAGQVETAMAADAAKAMGERLTAKRSFIPFTGDMAHVRWSSPARLMIHGQAVSSIIEEANGVSVGLGKSGELHVRDPQFDLTACALDMRQIDAGMSPAEAFRAAAARKEAAVAAMRSGFIARLADHCADLVEVKGAQARVFVHPEAVCDIACGHNGSEKEGPVIRLRLKGGGEWHGRMLHLAFDDAASRREALLSLAQPVAARAQSWQPSQK